MLSISPHQATRPFGASYHHSYHSYPPQVIRPFGASPDQFNKSVQEAITEYVKPEVRVGVRVYRMVRVRVYSLGDVAVKPTWTVLAS